MSRTVVIALDSSDLSERALAFARTIAHRWSGRIVMVHASDPHHKQAQDPLERKLDEVVRSMREEGITVDAILRAAPPAQAIVDVANERNADLIVMASHQRQGFNRWRNGSVTEEVLARTSTPLLVVSALGEPPTARSTRVLVPLDGSAVGEASFEFVRGWSAPRPIDMLLLRVVSLGPVVVGMEPAVTAQSLSPAEIEEEVRAAGEYLAGLAETSNGTNICARHQLIETAEPVAQVILDTARRERVDTIALGTHGKAGVSRLILGSVSEEVLERSPVPVLLVHELLAYPADLVRGSAKRFPVSDGVPGVRLSANARNKEDR